MGTAQTLRRARNEIVAHYSVLRIERLNGRGAIPIAVLLLDTQGDTLHFRFRNDLAEVADAEALDVLEGLADDIAQRAQSAGASKLFDEFLDSLSNYVRMEEPRTIPVPQNWRSTLDSLFDEIVGRLPDSPA